MSAIEVEVEATVLLTARITYYGSRRQVVRSTDISPPDPPEWEVDEAARLVVTIDGEEVEMGLHVDGERFRLADDVVEAVEVEVERWRYEGE